MATKYLDLTGAVRKWRKDQQRSDGLYSPLQKPQHPRSSAGFFIKLSKEERLLPINKKAGLMVYQQIKETGLDLADLSKSTLCGGAVFRP